MTSREEERESWSEYRRLVIESLKDLRDEIEALDKKLDSVKEDVIMLKVKSGMWGGVVGAIGSFLVSYIFNLLKQK